MNKLKILLFTIILLLVVGVISLHQTGFLTGVWATDYEDKYGFSFWYPTSDSNRAPFEFIEFHTDEENEEFGGMVYSSAYGDDVGTQVLIVGVYDESIASRIERIESGYDGSTWEEKYSVMTEQVVINNLPVIRVKSQMSDKDHAVYYLFSAPKDLSKTVEFYMSSSVSKSFYSFFDKFEQSLRASE